MEYAQSQQERKEITVSPKAVFFLVVIAAAAGFYFGCKIACL